MIIGTIKEIKNSENRVGLIPANVQTLVKAGNKVLVQKGSGIGSGFSDLDYEKAGAELFDGAVEIASRAELLVKIKEPLPLEYSILEALKGKALFTFLHLAAAEKQLTLELMKNNITAIAYETVEGSKGRLPLLSPMSEVAGVLAIQYGAQYLQNKHGGRGISLGAISNAESATVVVVGAGTVGAKAAITAAGLGCKVIILEKRPERIRELKKSFSGYLGKNLFANVSFLESTPEALAGAVKKADLLVGAVLVEGAKAPVVVQESHVRSMKKGSVIVDVAIDQGGCVFGSKATTHESPVFEFDGKIYCCIANMPGQVPLQSTQAITAATMPYIMKIARLGIVKALKADSGLAKGVNVFGGKVAFKPVAEALGLEYAKPEF